MLNKGLDRHAVRFLAFHVSVAFLAGGQAMIKWTAAIQETVRPEKVAVVGIGYVGVTLASVLAEAGYETIGVDVNPEKVSAINEGRFPFTGREPGMNELIRTVTKSRALVATTNILDAANRDAYFVCVDTPLDANAIPDLSILREVCRGIARLLRPGCLVSIESTLPPLTMQDVVIPILERHSGLKAGGEFSVVHCPERVMPGKLLNNVRNCSRVLGGIDAKAIDLASRYYSAIVRGELYPTGLLAAEVSKTSENAYRDVQIAFANEVALICERLGADAYEVRRLVNTCPFRDMHMPGSGVGGHCLPKDSWLLTNGIETSDLGVIRAARHINALMPSHLAELTEDALAEAKVPSEGAIISVMGLSFLRDSDDTRNSPAITIIDRFVGKAEVRVHDPFAIVPYKVAINRDLGATLQGSDCAVFVTDHSEYANLDLNWVKDRMRTSIIVDGRNIFDSKLCLEKGFVYRGIGKG